MKVRYIGNAARVDYPVSVERGQTVDVPAELARGLVKQSAWEKVKAEKKDKES